MFRKTAAGCLLVAGAVALSACGSSSSSSSGSSSAASSGGNTIDVYSSLPLQGAASSAQTGPAVNGTRLALKQAGDKAGQFKINYKRSTTRPPRPAVGPEPDGGERPEGCLDSRPSTTIGEFNSGASEISIPILNEAGAAQVSPANTYVGLTAYDPGARPASRRSTTRPGSARTRASCRSTRSRARADLARAKKPAARSSPWPTTRRRMAPGSRPRAGARGRKLRDQGRLQQQTALIRGQLPLRRSDDRLRRAVLRVLPARRHRRTAVRQGVGRGASA